MLRLPLLLMQGRGCAKENMTDTIDIYSSNPGPAGALSNFTAHAFVFETIPCASMEGFLQALTYANSAKQREVCALVGITAKEAANAGWRTDKTLHWQGKIFDRESGNYQSLLDRAYSALFMQNADFRAALAATGTAVLTHKNGGSNAAETLLTEEEFCSRLMSLRERLEDFKEGAA